MPVTGSKEKRSNKFFAHPLEQALHANSVRFRTSPHLWGSTPDGRATDLQLCANSNQASHSGVRENLPFSQPQQASCVSTRPDPTSK